MFPFRTSFPSKFVKIFFHFDKPNLDGNIGKHTRLCRCSRSDLYERLHVPVQTPMFPFRRLSFQILLFLRFLLSLVVYAVLSPALYVLPLDYPLLPLLRRPLPNMPAVFRSLRLPAPRPPPPRICSCSCS